MELDCSRKGRAMDAFDTYGLQNKKDRREIKTRVLLSLMYRRECYRFRLDYGPRIDEFVELAGIFFGPEAVAVSLPAVAGMLPAVLHEWNPQFSVLKDSDREFDSREEFEKHLTSLVITHGEWLPLNAPARQ
jgi:hypothetical protein